MNSSEDAVGRTLLRYAEAKLLKGKTFVYVKAKTSKMLNAKSIKLLFEWAL